MQRSQNFVCLFEMNAKNIVKEPTCYKTLSKPICIDLVITIPRRYQRGCRIFTKSL